MCTRPPGQLLVRLRTTRTGASFTAGPRTPTMGHGGHGPRPPPLAIDLPVTSWDAGRDGVLRAPAWPRMWPKSPAGAVRSSRRWHVAGRAHHPGPGRRGAGPSPPGGAGGHHPRGEPGQGARHHVVRQRPGPSDPSTISWPHHRVQSNPDGRSTSARILHNAVQGEDGSWVWRYRRFPSAPLRRTQRAGSCRTRSAPVGRSQPAHRSRPVGPRHVPQSVVDDADEAELLRRQPAASVVHVADAGHSVQGDTRSSSPT